MIGNRIPGGANNGFCKLLQSIHRDVTIPTTPPTITGSKIDFRRKMQTYGGYAERRQVLDDTIYSLCEVFDKINLKRNKDKENKFVYRKNLIKILKEKREIETRYGTIKFDSLNIKEGGNFKY